MGWGGTGGGWNSGGRRRRRGRAFVPIQLNGCALWVRSDMGTTVHEPAFPVPSDFADAAWSKTNLTPTLVSGTVYELDEGTAGPAAHDMLDAWADYYAGVEAEVSFRVKYVDLQWISIWVNNTGAAAYFDILNGVVGSKTAGVTSHSITALDDGWYKIAAKYAVSGGNAIVRFRLATADGVTVYTGSNRTVLVDTADV